MTKIHVVDRFGVIDIGSNSVRLVVFEGANRSPSYFYNEKVLCGLGIGLASSGVLNPDGRKRALATLKRFQLLTERMHLTKLRIVATEAVRRAKDGPDFCAQVKDMTGLVVDVISGREEASLSAQGVLLSNPKARGLICDIGGASMELGVLDQSKIGLTKSSHLGPMSIQALVQDGADEKKIIKEGVQALSADFEQKAEMIYLIGGSWRAIAILDMIRTDYPLHVLHEYEPELLGLKETLKLVSEGGLLSLAEGTSISSRRLNLLPVAARVLLTLLDALGPKRMRFSSFGLREGVLYNELSKEARAKDPLIEAARAEESARARFPGFGDALFDWLKPLFTEKPTETLRLIRAACLLHDVHWTSHPDYRAEVCFDAATHTNLSGLDHRGRVFLAWVLMNRYKPRGLTRTYIDVEGLISEEDQKLAYAVGLAIRLGAMMSSADPAHMGRLRLSETALSIELPADSAALFGEVVEKRFNALADALGRQPELTYT
ncbi:MAG: Ppx/GppA family phosphatase [Pseudomonadota bacterium]